jgi:hypothetical protein
MPPQHDGMLNVASKACCHLQRTHLHQVFLPDLGAASESVEYTQADAEMAPAVLSPVAGMPECMAHQRCMSAGLLWCPLPGVTMLQGPKRHC